MTFSAQLFIAKVERRRWRTTTTNEGNEDGRSEGTKGREGGIEDDDDDDGDGADLSSCALRFLAAALNYSLLSDGGRDGIDSTWQHFSFTAVETGIKVTIGTSHAR